MNLVYVALLGSDIGVNKKIKAQIDSLNRCGIHTEAYIYGIGRFDKKFLSPTMNYSKIHVHRTSKLYYILGTYELNYKKAALEQLENDLKDKKFDYIYLRYPCADPYLLGFIIKNRNKVIIEFQSKVLAELQNLNVHRARLVMERSLLPFILRYSKAIIGVTKEIEHYYKKKSILGRVKSIAVSNGIAVDSIPLRKPPKDINGELNLLCVSSMHEWHAVDRVIKGMALYDNDILVNLHIVGQGQQLKVLKDLVNKYKLNSNIFYYGTKTKEELDMLFNKCHIAIGSLGLHRIDLKFASTLKVREYMARGIPFILGYKDDDIKERINKYAYNVPADDSPININGVVKFAINTYRDKNHASKMRGYAKMHMDMGVKMSKLKKFIERIDTIER